MALNRRSVLGALVCAAFRKTGVAAIREPDGAFWKSMASEMRVVYSMGYMDAADFVCVNLIPKLEPDAVPGLLYRFWPQTMSGSQITAELDGFYAKPENLSILVPAAIQLAAAKSSGVDPAELERRAAALRKRPEPH